MESVAEFLQNCEKEFANRFTEDERGYKQNKQLSEKLNAPPLIEMPKSYVPPGERDARRNRPPADGEGRYSRDGPRPAWGRPADGEGRHSRDEARPHSHWARAADGEGRQPRDEARQHWGRSADGEGRQSRDGPKSHWGSSAHSGDQR